MNAEGLSHDKKDDSDNYARPHELAPVVFVFRCEYIGRSLGISHFLMKSIKRELYPVGRSELVKNSKHIVTHCVLAQAQLAGDVAVGQTFGYESSDSLFLFGQQCDTFGIEDSRRNRFDQGLN